jgi:phospho-N-acetylmuramoyl-pentapeptide-transferase
MVVGNFALAGIAVAASGALAGFLVYNIYPAKVFMGDTGSLYIGGLLACLVVAGGLWMWFIPLSVIYISEALSVIAQVVYFKLTKPYTPEQPMSQIALAWLKLTKRLPGEGKRLLRMAPLHHHFEALAGDEGIPEWQIVACFWLVQFLISAAVLFVYLYYNSG